MPDANDLKGLEDLGKEEIFDKKDEKREGEPVVRVKDGKQEITGITLKTSGRGRQGVIEEVDKVLKAPSIVIKTKMSAKDKAKFKNLPGASVVVVKKPRSEKSRKLPDHIRKAYITINDKDVGNPIKVVFEGDWVPSDINLAGKFLILDFQSFVRNRAMKGK